MPSIQWLTPAPIWLDGSAGLEGPAFAKPWLAELTGDRFLPDFLDLMEGRVPDQTPAALVEKRPETVVGDAFKLYQPLHGRYYLVAGSLVCRQLGLPDRRVAAQNGERTSFVVRRLTQSGEEAWIKEGATGRWQGVNVPDVARGEERLPMHPVAACAAAPPGPAADAFGLSACDRRTVHYGYVPADRRESYVPPIQDPLKALAEIPAPTDGSRAEEDVRLGEVSARVLRIWRRFFFDESANLPVTGADVLAAGDPRLALASLYLILDFGEFLQRVLPDVFEALGTNGSSLSGAAKAKRRALFDELEQVLIGKNGAADAISLADAIAERKADLPLVRGEGEEPAGVSYDLKAATRRQTGPPPRVPVSSGNAGYLRSDAVGDTLYRLIAEAVTEGGTPPEVPPEVADMIKDDPPDSAAAGPVANIERYVIRLVYDYPPCKPIVSQQSAPFTFARLFDPEAPARHIRIQLPDIKDLRRFKRGVGMEMSPSLRSMMDRVNKGMLDGGDLGPEASWQLGMICSFSIQIITLVAFIVMFIFLIALNFVFWWLAFLKICFPIPVRRSS